MRPTDFSFPRDRLSKIVISYLWEIMFRSLNFFLHIFIVYHAMSLWTQNVDLRIENRAPFPCVCASGTFPFALTNAIPCVSL
jgi:hypothetical protein